MDNVQRRTCVVKNCQRIKDNSDVSCHKFPKNSADKSIWESFSKKNNAATQKKWKFTTYSMLCSRHFQPCCFEIYGKYRYIKQGHHPHVFVNFNGELEVDEDLHKSEIYDCNEPMEVDDFSENQPQVTNIKTLPETDLYRTEINQLKSSIKFKDKIIKTLRQKLKRYSICKEHPATNPKPPKNRNIGTQVSYQDICNKSNQTYFLAIIHSLLERPRYSRNTGYSNLLKEFSLKLHYYSPKAYEFLRECFEQALPHPKSLQLWTSNIDTKPGLLSACFDFIKLRNETSPHQLYYSLSFDEMSIRKQIIYNGSSMVGYIDYGSFKSTNLKDTVATNALFVQACEINGSIKTPLAYILTCGLDSSLFGCVIKKVLDEMAKFKCVPISISFDGLPSNFSTAVSLGANFDIKSSSLKTSMEHPSFNNSIYFTPDACHMLKLLRNMLYEYGVLLDADGNEIRWSYFESLQKLQNKEGLRAANKVTQRHINFLTQKMKVKLVTQVLSSSVSVALSLCEKLGIEEFRGCSGTAKFAKLFDRLFDALNSFPKGLKFKAPLAHWNEKIWRALFSEAKEYLLSLKRKSDGMLIINTRRSTCIVGLIVCMKSLESIMDEIVLPGKTSLRYLPTYKLSQDHLELFFSSLRQRFGNNNNPNAQQLEFALRRMLAVTISPNLSGNCLPQDQTQSCGVSPLQKFTNNQLNNNEEQDKEELTALPSFSTLSLFVGNVVSYISGFVGRTIIAKLDCEPCVSSLINFETNAKELRSDFALLNLKDNGGLFIPSEELVKVCRITELAIREASSMGLHKTKSETILKNSLRHALSSNAFSDLRSIDFQDHSLFGTHVMDLIKMIVKQYTKIRLHYIAKEKTLTLSPVSVRNQMTKAVLFKGQ